jgi:Zn-finger nucleic acid-binding protein
MVSVELHNVEIDRCPSCGGILLDKGEQEVIDALGVAHIIESGAPVQPETLRTEAAHCHACDNPMIALMGAGDVEYDWCDKCERLFFDRGELSALDSFVDH